MNIIFEISGGIGKNIIATVILELLRKKYSKDKIIVFIGFQNQYFLITHMLIYYLVWLSSAKDRMREGVENGYVLPKSLTKKVIPQLKTIINTNLEENLFNSPIRQFPSTFSEEEKLILSKNYNTKPILVIHPQGGAIIKDGENQKSGFFIVNDTLYIIYL